MAKAAILAPSPEICELARSLANEYPHITPICIEAVQTDHAVERARELERQGCELIVARGLQALLIKRGTHLPLIEIQVTAQELGMLILDLRRELSRPRPKIALVGFTNMFSDTAHFNELFDIELIRCLVESNEELQPAAEAAVRNGAQAVIGGDLACAAARRMGAAAKFLPSGAESIRSALRAASRACYAIDLEKRNRAEMDAMLDYTFSGIMRIDRSGCIRHLNRAMASMMGTRPEDVLGKDVREVLPKLDRKRLDEALYDGKEAYAFLLSMRDKANIVNIAPILINERIEGAILTVQEGSRIIEIDSVLRRELYQRGFVAKCDFGSFVCASKKTEAAVTLAKRVSKYASPVLLLGERGCGKSLLAQCIHNESMLKNNAFITLDCSAWTSETLDTMLFGNFTTKRDTPACMAELAKDGTLYLAHVDALSPEAQYKLLNLIQGRFIHNGSYTPSSTTVRVIASTGTQLIAKVERGEFRSDLYYALSVLSIELPPLRLRREDIRGWFGQYFDLWQEKYRRYFRLTQGAWKLIEAYDWPGNLEQISSVCERVVLLAEKHSIDEVFLRRQLEQVAPRVLPGTDRAVLVKDPQAVRITELLRKHGGNRSLVAQELGVSKTTLWRYMKKYGIEPDYSY